MKVWLDKNKDLHINFDKFDASCRDNVWTTYLPVNIPTGNKFRDLNARFEFVGTVTFENPKSTKVKNFYITAIQKTNP
tara:strand:+ start:991 stop:1224 length:234 start_codon:yes stop_codon:yes gene_type:complete